ncbi:hypothetical protein C6497_06550 [Candidatus Poribacteria bacterium]|nr:MAG: hypothetical protein C6497_06550 [Candidatus Poribacteria bacterium]
MKALLKGLIWLIFILIIIGFCGSIYILNAPPVPKEGEAKLQIHKRTALRGRPSVNSKPILYTKDVFIFSMDSQYLSNLNSGILSSELLFSIALGQRTNFSAELLDKELQTSFDWKKTFLNSAPDMKFSSGKPTIKVLLSGRDWILSDSTGASYHIEKVDNHLSVYLPDLREEFNNNKITLSDNLEFSIEDVGKQWLINDRDTVQVYEIRNNKNKLDVFQQSKYPIQSFLFSVDLASLESLNKGNLTSEIRQGFTDLKAPLSPNVKLSSDEIGLKWKITDGQQLYRIHNEENSLRVYLDLDSTWLLVRVNDTLKGWMQRITGTIHVPPKPMLSSRQELKVKLLTLFAQIKDMVSNSNETDTQTL